jgi:ABC-type phosphate/phosphonate transport system substrate-binding protein
MLNKSGLIGLFFIAVFPMQTLFAADALIFSTAPTQSPEQTIALYQSLVEHLSAVTGKKIILKPAKNFPEYTHDMHKGVYDILFDGPQFVGWRMAQHEHQVIARLPGSIRFVVVSRDDANINNYQQLAGKKVCSFASPNLLSLGFLDLFPRAASQPILVRVKSFKGALDCVRNGEGVAAVMRDKFWEKRTPEEKQGLYLLYATSKPFPHRAFSVSNRVDEATRKAIVKALVSEGGIESAQAILQHFRSKQFLPARPQEYSGMGALLNPVWGYRAK